MRHRFGGPEPDNYPMNYRIARDRMRGNKPETIVYLREMDAGTDNAAWVICAKADAGAVAFVPYWP